MIEVKFLSGHRLQLNKNEAKEAQRIAGFLAAGSNEANVKAYAQKSWDIWARSAPTEAAKARRIAVAQALGLDPVIRFL